MANDKQATNQTEVYCKECAAILFRATCSDKSELFVETDFDMSCDGKGKHTVTVLGKSTTVGYR